MGAVGLHRDSEMPVRERVEENSANDAACIALIKQAISIQTQPSQHDHDDEARESIALIQKILDFAKETFGFDLNPTGCGSSTPAERDERCTHTSLAVMLLTSAAQYVQVQGIALEDSLRSKFIDLLRQLFIAEAGRIECRFESYAAPGTSEASKGMNDTRILSTESMVTSCAPSRNDSQPDPDANTTSSRVDYQDDHGSTSAVMLMPEHRLAVSDETTQRSHTTIRGSSTSCGRRERGRTGALLATGVQGTRAASCKLEQSLRVSSHADEDAHTQLRIREAAHPSIDGMLDARALHSLQSIDECEHRPDDANLGDSIAEKPPRPSASNPRKDFYAGDQTAYHRVSAGRLDHLTEQQRRQYHRFGSHLSAQRPESFPFPVEAFELSTILCQHILRDLYPMLSPVAIERLVCTALASDFTCWPLLCQLFLLHCMLKLAPTIPEVNYFWPKDEAIRVRPTSKVEPFNRELLSYDSNDINFGSLVHDHGRRLAHLWRSMERRRTALLRHHQAISISNAAETSETLAALSATLYGIGFPLAQLQCQWILENVNRRPKEPSVATKKYPRKRSSMDPENLIPVLVQVARVAVASMKSSRIASKNAKSPMKAPESPPMAVELLSSVLSLLIDFSHADARSCSLLCQAGIDGVLRALWSIDLEPAMDITDPHAVLVRPISLPFDLRVLLLVLLVNLLEQSAEARELLLLQGYESPSEAFSAVAVDTSVLTYLALVVAAQPAIEQGGSSVEPVNADKFETFQEHAIAASYAALALACAAVRERKWMERIRRSLPHLSFQTLADILDAFSGFLAHIEEAGPSISSLDAGIGDTLYHLITRLRALDETEPGS
ncbi:hypothetical protein CCYA_CCYA07G2012 [Cyanidiococcus yangmingshanensis]|nr:hypothetical protein CCYA_CCYA07G2012 [Cyanidiococcus yangmingshanensis]